MSNNRPTKPGMVNSAKTMNVNEAIAFARKLYDDEKRTESDKVIAAVCEKLKEPAASELRIKFSLATNQVDPTFACAETAVGQGTLSPQIYAAIGLYLYENAMYDEAQRAYENLVALEPDDADGWFNVAFLLLLGGDFHRGLASYEWRQKCRQVPKKQFDIPQWSGEALVGKRILVHEEQGIGDTFMFARYLPWLKASGGTVVFQCRDQLAAFFENSSHIDQRVASVKETEPCDFHVPLLSLPLQHQTRLDNIPNSVPYITPQAERVETWKSRLGEGPQKKVGVVWAGNPKNKVDGKRSIPGKLFSQLLENETIRFFSLQVGEKSAEIQDPRLVPIAAQITDYQDTAAILAHMDLVLTVDTSVAHLAGAMGKPVWILLPHVPTDWRWLLHREDSPWYPSARLFRQKTRGDWEELLSRVEEQLRALVDLD